jgi:outer membrane protein assembly factor BamB
LASLVTNAPNRIRGYDPNTGKELWQLGGSSKITAPTPIYSKALIYVASGRRPEAPIFAIRPGGHGDITPGPSEPGGKFVAWRKQQRGSYMPTPILYRGLLYVLGNAGIFDCYDAATGEEVYRERIPHQVSGFSASPIASDGRIFLPGEDGDVFVIQAGASFVCLAGILYVRGERNLFAIGR